MDNEALLGLIPLSVLSAAAGVERLTEMAKLSLRPYVNSPDNPNGKLHEDHFKAIIIAASLLFGLIAFVIGDSVSADFQRAFPTAPYYFRVALGAFGLGFGSNALRFIWALKKGLENVSTPAAPAQATNLVMPSASALDQAKQLQNHPNG